MQTLWIHALRHASTVALGVALLGAAHVSQRAISAPEVPRPEADLERTLAYLDGSSRVELRPPPWRDLLRDALDPARVPAAEPWPSWLAHRRPGVVYHVAPPPPPRERRHGAPALVATPGRGQVELAWRAPRLQGLDLVGYRLERRSPEGEWAELARVGFEVTSWVDRDVAGDLPLAYRVTSRVQSDDGAEVPSALLERSGQASARALPTWVVVPRRRVELARGTPGVQLELYRWDGAGFTRSLLTVGVGAPLADSGWVLSELGDARELAVRVSSKPARPGFDPLRWRTPADRPHEQR